MLLLMHHSACCVGILLFVCLPFLRFDAAAAVSLFDGHSLDGWEGNASLWRVEDGAITGGSRTNTIKNNDFLCTTRSFTNFLLRLSFKLTGTDGFINSGIQVRSQRVPNSHEVAGYQCDLGDPDWWGAIYDEARRNRVLIPTDMVAVNQVVRRGDWNSYAIRTDGPRVTIWLNGLQITDYYEEDPAIPEHGVIGIQVHGGGKTLIQVKDIVVDELPPTRTRFVGAPTPPKAAKPSPLTPVEAQKAFSLPPGFEIEMVASEEQGVNKPITVTWDAKGHMWTMTALEYPVDANDNKEIAEALYKQPRRDKVLVFKNAYGPGPHTPSVFAEGFAIPLGLLPYQGGAYVQHGSEILFLRDEDQDGRADRREAILTGFGIGDSHLLPHQFTRMPGNWIWFAQGAFNNSQVQTKAGESFEFNRTLLGRFTPEGDRFETIGWGPCNIWGLVVNSEGEVFIQEANDYGYPVMPFHIGGFYPGCTPAPKPYTPTFPGLARLGMGGTGLSGLALSDATGSFPDAYADVFYIANPVKQRIQAVKLFKDGPHYSLLKLPDFVISSDEWFRPVAIHFGPDGCLYIVDWCNRVISHNEVPREHPDRDKHRGRIWRVRHQRQTREAVPDFTRIPEAELVSHLGSTRLWHAHTAWQQLVDRKQEVKALAPLVRNAGMPTPARIQALWALEGLGLATVELLEPLITETNRNLRREAVRILAKVDPDFLKPKTLLQRLVADPDPEVRAELIRAAAKTPQGVQLLVTMAQPALTGPLARNTQNGRPIKVREAYDRDFERYLIRAGLERFPTETADYLERTPGLTVESRLLAALALEPRRSASLIAMLLPELNRAPNEEELLRLAEHLEQPGVGQALRAVLQNPKMRRTAAEGLLSGRTRLDASRLTPLMEDAAVELLTEDPELAVKLGSGFKLKKLEEPLIALLNNPQRQLLVLRALRELGSTRADLFAPLAMGSRVKEVRQEAVLALTAAPTHLLGLWSHLDSDQRRLALDQLASSRSGAEAILSHRTSDAKSNLNLDGPVLEKMLAVLSDDPRLKSLLESMGSVVRSGLRLDGRKESYVASSITLRGPFTVETWIRLDANISNDDGILGRPGGADFNFAEGRFRIYGGPETGDRIIAKRRMTADLWTHIAATRDDDGRFRLYIDGELDTAECRPLTDTFDNLQIGRVSPPKGTSGMLAEYRVWDHCRTPEAIRRDFDRSFEGEPRPEGLVHYSPGAGPWGKLSGTARVVPTLDAPPLLTSEEAKAHSEKLRKFKALAETTGDLARGKQLTTTCLACHIIQSEGANIGPNLSGAGAMNLEALLRSLLTPNAAMEAGYRIFRVELESDDVIDGFLVSQDNNAIVLRIPNSEDRRIPRSEVRRAHFIRRSLMPEGLLEGLPDKDAADLLAYLRSLK